MENYIRARDKTTQKIAFNHEWNLKQLRIIRHKQIAWNKKIQEKVLKINKRKRKLYEEWEKGKRINNK